MLLEHYTCSKEYINFEAKMFLIALTKKWLVTYLNNYVVTSIIVRSNFIRIYHDN